MKCPTVPPSIRVALVEDGYIAHDAKRDKVHHLNGTAAFILELCDGTRSVKDIEGSVVPLLPQKNSQIVEHWIETAEQDGLITFEPVSNAGVHAIEADGLATLATRLREGGHVQEALLCLQRATELRPNDGAMWYQLGELAHIVGKRNVARSAYRRYLEIEPDDVEIQHIMTALCDEPAPDRASDDCIQQLYARFSKFYETNMREELDYRAPEELLTALAQHIPPPSAQLRILDLGCGTGFAGELLKPWAARLVGIDLSSEMIDKARQSQIYDTLEVAEITAWLSADDQVYDLIVACDSLIYFGELGQVLGPAADRLVPEGLFGFTVEKSAQAPYKLNDSGRYAHDRKYLRQVALQTGLIPVTQREITLREEYGEPVVGIVTALVAGAQAQHP